MSPRPLVVAELRAAHDDTIGGPDKTICAGAAQHDPQRVRVVPVYLAPPQDRLPALRRLASGFGVEPVLIPDPDRWGRAAGRALSALHEHDRFDVVHTHDVKSDFVGWWWTRGRGVALLATAHGWSRPRDLKLRVYNTVDRRLLRRFPRVLAVSRVIARQLAAGGIPETRISVFPNGVDLDRWRPASAPAPRPEGLPAQGRLVGMVSRLSEDKDLPLLVNAFERIADNHEDVHLIVVGDGPARFALSERVRTSRHAGRIHGLGRRADVPELMAAFDVFALATRAEGMPNVLLEAMASRRPIVASRVGGVEELVGDGQEGLLVEVGDTAGFTAAVSSLLEDPARAEELAAAARRRVETEFSFEGRIRRLETIYEELVARNAGSETQ